MKILMVGDVVSSQGCDFLRQQLPRIKREFSIDVTIVNGENSASGNGMLPASAEHIFDSGADVITGGNHSLQRREVYEYLDEDNNVLRPANLYRTAPGKGWCIIEKSMKKIGVINLMGSVYLDGTENPFDAVDGILKSLQDEDCKIIIVDFHGEATAEKRAMGFYLDGKVSAFAGTHTHVQTSDAQVLQKGTGYITDLGMTGPFATVLGVKAELAIEKIRTSLPVRFVYEDVECTFEGCIFDVDDKSGKCTSAASFRR